MARVLLLNPSKWGRGITFIWIPSHVAVLKARGHDVKLFDCTFYKDWTVNEVAYNTQNRQYKPTEYETLISYNDNNVYRDLQNEVGRFKPDIIFWGGLSSHIHGEGEYVNIQYGHDMVKNLKNGMLMIAGGLQPTAAPEKMFDLFPAADCFIRGESEFVLAELADKVNDPDSFYSVDGLVYRNESSTVVNQAQELISDMDAIPPYDYSLFDKQVFLRPYNGRVVNAVDYELSRGCIYTCAYCVETVIQRYYGFSRANSCGVLKGYRNYLRNKRAERVFHEVADLHEKYDIELIRCQDTNFLTIDRKELVKLASLLQKHKLPVKLYIETRPEGINDKTVELLLNLNVDGVGMGLELATEEFRQDNLNRFSNQQKIINAFKLLENAGIKRTSYNMIGLPGEDEEMILKTIELNHQLKPDNMTVAFYSPYIGTALQRQACGNRDFEEYEFDVDGQIRSASKSALVDKNTLEFYKRHFIVLAREGLADLQTYKKKWSEGDGCAR